jgi:hypothetical protein
LKQSIMMRHVIGDNWEIKVKACAKK